MRYSPIFGENSINRKYLGKYWTKKQSRGIQNHESLKNQWIHMLNSRCSYIINRNLNIENGNRGKMKMMFNSLSEHEHNLIFKAISTNDFKTFDLKILNSKIREILNIYKNG
ncbi:MAG: hypothetical protein A2V64_01840 [Bacteroidetes bacterium RBG_13_43_22]|nr:MAG: hypothetical protein A2V64_01840 [Bacteroidetes bacterium RBG_13_43_22]